MDEPAQSLDISTLHNVYVVNSLIQLTVESDAEITAKSLWTEDLTFWRVLTEYAINDISVERHLTACNLDNRLY